MKNKMNKRGVIEQLQSLVIPLVGIALVLTIGFLIFSEVKTQVRDTTGVSTSYTYESFSGYTTGAYKALTYSGNCMSLTCSEVQNGTPSNVALPTAMYNCSNEGLQVSNASSNGLAPKLNVSYSCVNRTIAWNATETIQNATQDIPGWLTIIIICIIGSLLLALVAMFKR